MTPADESELQRLCDLLDVIDGTLDGDSPLREAIVKAGLALQHGFIHGLRAELELGYQQLDADLSGEQRASLRNMGIDPNAA